MGIKDDLVRSGMWGSAADVIVGRASTAIDGEIKGTPASGVIAAERGNEWFHSTVLTCTAKSITMTDDAGVAQYGGSLVYTFPQGMIMVMGAVIDGSFTGYASLIDTFDGDIAIGTVTATTGATLTGTEANIMPSVALTQAVDEVAICDAVSVATALTESGARWIDGTSTAVPMFLNFVVDDDAAHGAGTATFTGTISFLWAYLGDK